MKTMYQIFFRQIEALPVARETEKQVIRIDGKGREYREAKVGSLHSWHATWEDAHAHLIAQTQAKVDSLRLQLERANGDLGRIKGMKKPEGEA